MAIVKVTSAPVVHRMQVGPVEAIRLRFQSGIPGPQGPEGPQGDVGPQGPTGETGPPGEDLTSGAYLPLAGGTLTGDLVIEDDDLEWKVATGGTANKKRYQAWASSDNYWYLYAVNDAGGLTRMLLKIGHDGGVIPNQWTTAQRPASPLEGMLGYNSTLTQFEGYYGGGWQPLGAVVDRAYGDYSTNAALTALIPVDDTAPTNAEGTQIISISFTPKSTTNRVRLTFTGNVATDAARRSFAVSIFAGATNLRTIYGTSAAADYGNSVAGVVEHVPGVTTAVTYTVRAGPAAGAGAIRFNGTNSARLFGGACAAVLVVEEIKA